VHIFTVPALEQFVSRLYESEKKWDSIQRFPYSTPGRWVHSFNITSILHINHAEDTVIDIMLTKLFPLLPFLSSLCLCNDLALSATALASFRAKDGLERIMTLKGYKVPWLPRPEAESSNSSLPALEILGRLEGIQRLEIVNGDGPRVWLTTYDPVMPTDPHDPMFFPTAPAIHLPHLTYLSVFAPFPTPAIAALLRAALPALQHLTITPSDDAPHGAARALLNMHGANLHTLRINQPCTWHALSGREPFPVTALRTSPQLRRLALDYPLAPLAAPPAEGHPLQVLTIPCFNSKFLKALEGLLPRLPHLSVVRLRNERCLTGKAYRKALEAGVQGEMREWKVRLARKKVRLVDGNWKEPL
jgi:hypothetical protein